MTTKIFEITKWRLIDSHWCCVYRKFKQDDNEENTKLYSGTLADYLWMIGFEFPCISTIKYCLAENDRYTIKYRYSGGIIDIFLHTF